MSIINPNTNKPFKDTQDPTEMETEPPVTMDKTIDVNLNDAETQAKKRVGITAKINQKCPRCSAEKKVTEPFILYDTIQLNNAGKYYIMPQNCEACNDQPMMFITSIEQYLSGATHLRQVNTNA